MRAFRPGRLIPRVEDEEPAAQVRQVNVLVYRARVQAGLPLFALPPEARPLDAEVRQNKSH